MENQHQAEQTGSSLRNDTRGGGGWRVYQRGQWENADCALGRWRLEGPDYRGLDPLA